MLVAYQLYQQIKDITTSPGIYIWKDKAGNILYIGKAVNLRKRLLNYCQDEDKLDTKTSKWVPQAQKIEVVTVRNELEAILLEMNLIRTLKPKYNILSKDDKRPLYALITKSDFPRVKTARIEVPDTGEYFGPFPSSYQLKMILKKIRRIFPYCSCDGAKKKPCLFTHIGYCKPCPFNYQSLKSTDPIYRQNKTLYQKNISKLRMILKGRFNPVLKILEKEMIAFSEKLQFEKANEIKMQMEAIRDLLTDRQNIGEYLSNRSLSPHIAQSQLAALCLFLGVPKLHRIEGYDIANTSGTNPTSSMVVAIEGLPDTTEYRKFSIQKVKGPNDPAMIKHTLERRLQHPEWDYPDLILIDGGKTQLAAAHEALEEANVDILTISLAKRLEQIVMLKNGKFTIFSPNLDEPYLVLLRSIRDEAHRFCTTYHKKLRQKGMLGEK